MIVVPDGIDVDFVGRFLGFAAAAAATADRMDVPFVIGRPRPVDLAVIVMELAID